MARARNIKPGLFKNEILGVADPLYTLMFEGLWTLADREGRLEDRPMRIKAEVFPYRNVETEEMLDWLKDNEFIERYLSGGKAYILIKEFVKHQNPHKNEPESVIPAPVACRNVTGITSENLGTEPENLGSAPADSLSLDSLTTDSLQEPLSDKSDETREAKSILEYLNVKSRSAFRFVPANLNLVKARLRDATPDEIRRVIDAKVQDWGGDKNMQDYLRPKTLFAASNFENYLGSLGTKNSQPWWVRRGYGTAEEAYADGQSEAA